MFPVCVYKFLSHYLNNINFYRQQFWVSSDRITLYLLVKDCWSYFVNMMQTTTKWEFYKTSGMGWALSLMKKAYFIAESVNC